MRRGPLERIRHGSLAALALATVAACGGRPSFDSADDLRPVGLDAPSLASAVVGCWQLAWDFDGGRTRDPRRALPDSVALRGNVLFGTPERIVSPATHPEGRRAGSSADPDPWEVRFTINRWWAEDGLLRVRFSDGGEQAWNVMMAPVGEDLLRGRAQGSDRAAGLGARETNVTARRISCEFE